MPDADADIVAPGSKEFWCMVAAAILLVLFGGLMSGLTLGLLSVEELELKIVQRVGSSKERRMAAAVCALIERRHLLLVTLLLCNAAAMEALPLVLDRLLNPVGAVVISVTAVLAFGEIMPQAYCKAHGLAAGARAAPLVRCLLVVCAPIAWPIAKLLDCLLGKEEGHFLRAEEMSAAVEVHRETGHLNPSEAEIMLGALRMAQKRCQDAMTPISFVERLSANSCLDESTMDWIVESGLSRIPVHVPGQPNKFLGFLLIKTLIKLRPEDAWPVSTQRLRPLIKVSEDEPLYKILDMFQTGQTHMAVVYPKGTELGDNFAPLDVEPLGILTLEDVMEELINEEIVDETDRLIDMAHQGSSALAVRTASNYTNLVLASGATMMAPQTNGKRACNDVCRQATCPSVIGRGGQVRRRRRMGTRITTMCDLATARVVGQPSVRTVGRPRFRTQSSSSEESGSEPKSDDVTSDS